MSLGGLLIVGQSSKYYRYLSIVKLSIAPLAYESIEVLNQTHVQG